MMLETLPSHFPDAAGTGEHEEWSKAPRWGKETPAPGENHTSCAYRRERRDWRNVYLHKAMAKPAMAKLPLLAIEDMLAPRWDAHFQNYRPKMDCVHWCNRPSVWEPVLMQLRHQRQPAQDGIGWSLEMWRSLLRRGKLRKLLGSTAFPRGWSLPGMREPECLRV